MFRTAVPLFLLCGLPLQLRSQPDPDELLHRAVTKIGDTLDRLPKYMCTQTIERDQISAPLLNRNPNRVPCDTRPVPAQSQWIRSDRLRLDVAATLTGEMYSWAGEGRFHDEELHQLIRSGYIASGGFSGFLGSVFGNEGTTFSYRGATRVEGRQLQEYGFRIPLERSQYRFGRRDNLLIVAYDGTFWLDPQTADLVRLVVRVIDPPVETGACSSTNTLEYGHTRIHDTDFLLPKEIRFETLDMAGVEARNRTLFSGCHEFLGESTLQFGAPDPARVSPPAPATTPPLDLPSGLPFTIAFTEAIDTRVAASGDRVGAKLTSSIVDTSGRVLLAAGTPLTVRILQIERNTHPDANRTGWPAISLMMLFRLETANVGGTVRRMTAIPTERAQSFAKGKGTLTQNRPLGTLDSIMSGPGVAMVRFLDVPNHYVIKAGTESKWTTGGTGGRTGN